MPMTLVELDKEAGLDFSALDQEAGLDFSALDREAFVRLPKPAFPSGTPRDIRSAEEPPKPIMEESRRMEIGAAPEPTDWQKFKQFFTTDRPPLPPNADRMEYFDRAFDIAIGSPLRVFLKYAKGRTLNIPDLMWAGIKKITPDSMWDEEVKKMNLDQAMDWAGGHDPSGFEKIVGELAEFIGRLQTAKGIGQATGILGKTPKDITKLIRAGEAAKLWGLAATGREFSKLVAETIDPDTDYQYEGAVGILRDMLIGAGLSLGSSVIVKPTLAKAAQSVIGRKIIDAADRVLINLSKKFPQLMDAVRKNPEKYFVEKTEEYLKYRGIKPTDLTPQQRAVVNHVARESQRRFVRAYKNYVPPPDIVYRAEKPRVPLRITGRPPIRPPVTPPAKKGVITPTPSTVQPPGVEPEARMPTIEAKPTPVAPEVAVAEEVGRQFEREITAGKVARGQEFEVFKRGQQQFDITAGYDIVREEGAKLKTFDSETVPQLRSAFIQKDKAIVEKADIRKPILLGTTKEGSFVIDGHHRVEKAIQENKPIQGYVLTQKQTAKISSKIGLTKPIAPKPGVKAPEKPAEAEVELGAELGTESPAFNKHLDYFQSKQLPETSKIRAIQKAIQVINGKRLAGKLTPQQANKKIAQLRRQLYQVAQREGVSVRMTEGGKVLLAVRKAGTYAPEEFSRYGKFQNVYPLGQDVSRSIQQIDGALSIKEKVKLKGQAGATERFVFWPTREMSKQKLEYIKEKSVQLKKILETKRGTKEDAQINEVLEKIAKEDRNQPIKNILSDKTIKAMAVKPSVVKQAVQLRKFYDDLIEEQNQIRQMRNQDPIPYRRNYSPHILRDVTIWERMMMKAIEKPREIFGKKAPLPDYIKPNKPFNPREMAREAGIPYEERVKSAIELAQSYLVTAAKDIFNTSIIQNNKAFIQQLETLGNKNAANFISDWTAEAYAGIAPALDRVIKLTQLPKAQRGMRWFNRIRNLAVFPLNFSWNLLTQTSSLALTVGKYGSVNTARGFYQWLHPSIRKQAAKDYYSYIVKSAKQGRITRQDAQNLIGETVELRRTTGELARDISTYFLEQLEKILTGTSIRAAHLHGAKRGLTGEALKNYASDGGAKTQSMYNDEDKPALLRSVAIKTGAPYQTFTYEVMNTLREWAGRTGTPPDTMLYTIWTVLRFLAAASVFAAIAKKGANKDIWSWKRPPIPFAEFWLTPIIKIFSKEYIGGSASGLTSPVETARRIAKGIDDVLETNNWRKLRNELTKYGPSVFGIPGGVQWSRMVDAIIAYSQGGVRDRRGRLLFKMEDPQDLVQAMFSGVWSTEEGRKYLEKRTGK